MIEVAVAETIRWFSSHITKLAFLDMKLIELIGFWGWWWFEVVL